jgi:excisionase family DNA binding protein
MTPEIEADPIPTLPAAFEKFAYTIAEAPKVLGIGRDALYDLIRSGELKPFSLGGKKHIHRDDLKACADRAFEREHRHPPGIVPDDPLARRPRTFRNRSTTRP